MIMQIKIDRRVPIIVLIEAIASNNAFFWSTLTHFTSSKQNAACLRYIVDAILCQNRSEVRIKLIGTQKLPMPCRCQIY